MSSSPRPDRWFSEAAVDAAVKSLQAEVARIPASIEDGSPAPPRQDDSLRLAIGVVVVVLVLLALLVGALTLSGKRNPDHQLNTRSYVILGAIFIGLPASLFVWTRFFYGKRTAQLQERAAALHALAHRHATLRCGQATKITGSSVGVVPWVATELDRIVECALHGSYRGHALTLVDCTYVVDMTLSAIESSFGKLGAAIMSHVEHEHIHRRCLEAVVFFEPLPELPDIFWAERKQPLNWYFRKQVDSDMKPLEHPTAWLVSSDPVSCRQALTARLLDMLEERPQALLQVLGGYVIVVPQTWAANRPVDMPREEGVIAKNLDWACALYEALGGTAASPATSLPTHRPLPVEVLDRAANPLLAEDLLPLPVSTEAAAAAPVKSRRWLRITSLVIGLLFAGCGGLIVFAMSYLTVKANNAASWPTVEGRILEATVAVKGEAAKRWAPQVRYEYEVNGTRYESNQLAIGSVEWASDRSRVEGIVAQYPQGQTVQVYYNPDRPADAVLVPGLGSSLTCFLVTGGVIVLLGLVLVYFGLRRPRVGNLG